jgi:hypothetical protein
MKINHTNESPFKNEPASNKITKHKKVYSNNQDSFISFVIDTFDFPAPTTMNHLKSSKGHFHKNLLF